MWIGNKDVPCYTCLIHRSFGKLYSSRPSSSSRSPRVSHRLDNRRTSHKHPFTYIHSIQLYLCLGMKTVRIFSDRIRDWIRLEGSRSILIRVRIFNIRYRIRIRIIKLHIYDVDIQSYPIRQSWQYPYSNPNSDRNMKTNVISVISVRIRSVFIHTYHCRSSRVFILWPTPA